MGPILSAALGAAFGVVYTGLGVLTHAIAARAAPLRGMQIELLGLVSRMMLALAAVTVVLAGTSAEPGPFVLSFLAVFALGLAADIARLARSRSSASAASPPAPPPPRTPSVS